MAEASTPVQNKSKIQNNCSISQLVNFFKVIWAYVDIIEEKVHYNKNTFTSLEFSKFYNILSKNIFLNFFEKVKIIKVLAGFEPMTYRSVVSILTH